MLHSIGITSENTFSNFSLPKCGSADMIHSIALQQTRKDYSRSDDEYSDPSIILDSDDEDDDDCIFSDFDLSDDFTIPNRKAIAQPKEFHYDMAQVLQNEETSQIIPYGLIAEVQGSKFSQYRFLLADWLFNLSFCYPTNTETLFQCFKVMDTYLSKKHVPLSKLQLIGCSCLWICSKVDFHTIETLDPLTKNCHQKYTKAEFRQAEIDILTTVDYKIQTASANYFLKYFLEKINASAKLSAIASFYSEVSLLYMNFSSYAPSVIALSSLIIANHLLNNACDLRPLKCYLKNVCQNDILLCTNMLNRSGGNIITREKLGICKKLRRRYHEKDIDLLIAKSADLFESFSSIVH